MQYDIDGNKIIENIEPKMIPERFNVFKSNMINMIRISEQEYKIYQQTKDIIYLQQAGEKLWNAFESYIQYINMTIQENYYDIKQMIRKGALRDLFQEEAYPLHKFFYRGVLEMDEHIAVKKYEKLLPKLKYRADNIDKMYNKFRLQDATR